ncbi:MAG: amino acid adenylation domain-containing protein, partial [bacterium]|nr:amino acid adenylation domain-containing protein [bacterium]
QELNKRSGGLARELMEKGVVSETIIGIMLERSIEMVVGLLGILKAGGAYLPIAAHYPLERKRYLLKDAGVKLLLTTRSFSEVPALTKEAIYLEDHFQGTEFLGTLPEIPSSGLAYVIYTSGSTGAPKGVLVEHRNVVRLVKGSHYITFSTGDRLLQTGALEFDASTFETWGSLLNGLNLFMVSADDTIVPEKLKHCIHGYGIDTMWLTSALFNRLAVEDIDIFAGLKNLLVGGDLLSPNHINRVRARFPALNLINGYGPTENTTFSTTYSIREETLSIPIGRPISNSRAYIVDKHNQPVPQGVSGELIVGGDGVARGYLNNPQQTAEKFLLPHKTQGKEGQKALPMNVEFSAMSSLYKTGDLCRWLEDGNIEFLGRMDRQMKLRGYRIELGEIENRILQHEDIAQAVVTAGIDDSGDKYLCAYITAGRSTTLASVDNIGLSNELSEYLAQTLPQYMIPSYFRRLEKIPLTANNKVDRKRLPEPERGVAGDAYLPPKDDIEKTLVKIWAQALGIDADKIGRNADFFRLGGHSLKATVLTVKIHKKFNVKIPLSEVFKNPTVSGMSLYIEKSKKNTFVAIQPAEKKPFYPLSSAQKRLYILQQMEPDGTAYNMPEVIPMVGEPDREKLENTIIQLIRRHESLRTSFHIINDEPVQVIHDSVNFNIDYFETDAELTNNQNLHNNEKVDNGRLIQKSISEIQHSFNRSFDLSQAPLLRVALLKHGDVDNGYLLLVDMHHIISDGISHEILQKDFNALYMGKELPPLRIQYKDYSEWQHSETEKQNLKQQETYWLKKYEGELPALNIPTDYSTPLSRSFEGSTFNFRLDADITAAVKQLVLEENATTFIMLLAVFNLFISKLSRQDDIIVGTPLAGR